MAKVSIIVTTFNRANMISKSLNSVLCQTFKDFELIVVDDGSTDNTKEVIGSIDDERIKYFYKDNGGVSSARNYGFNKSQGEYVVFLDSDDLYYPEKIKAQFEALESNPDYDICYHPVKFSNLDGSHIRVRDIESLNIPSGYILKDFFNGRISQLIHIMSLFFRRECFEVLVGFDENLRVTEDTDLILRAKRSFKFYGLKIYLSEYVQHGGERLVDGLEDDGLYKLINKNFIKNNSDTSFKLRNLAKSYYYAGKGKELLRSGSNTFGAIIFMLKAFVSNPLNFKNAAILFNPFKLMKQRYRYINREKGLLKPK